MIDRIAPTRRPAQMAVMRQKWRDLMFVHWPISPGALRPLIPAELELDLFDGTAYVGLVPFTMKGVRPVGLPAVAGLSCFHETNVRTYVRLRDRDPGVWFFNLEAASAIAVRLARSLFHLPYHFARMFLEHEPASQPTEAAAILYAGTRVGLDLYRPRMPCGRDPWALSNPRRPELSNTSSWSVTSSSRPGREAVRGRVHHDPYPLQSRRSSLWTRLCWRRRH